MKSNQLNIQKIIMMAKRKRIEIKENGEINRLTGCKGIEKRSIRLPQKSGYDKIFIRIEGKYVSAMAHRVTWTFFRGRIPEGYTINHKDGNKKNNAIENLEVMTQKEQTYHAMYILKTRNCMKREKNINAKIKMRDARMIRRMRREYSMKYREIQKFYTISGMAISDICNYRTWKEEDELVQT